MFINAPISFINAPISSKTHPRTLIAYATHTQSPTQHASVRGARRACAMPRPLRTS